MVSRSLITGRSMDRGICLCRNAIEGKDSWFSPLADLDELPRDRTLERFAVLQPQPLQ